MSDCNIKVTVKVRPLIKRERDAKLQIQWKIVENSIQPIQQLGGQTSEQFNFDHIFGENVSTEHMFNVVARPIVHATLKGFNGTIFAYGQTSSGKTHTMLGNDAEPGIMVLAVREIFQEIENSPDREFMLRIGYIEIYNEKVYDLLDKNAELKLQGNKGVSVPHKEFIVNNEDLIMNYMQIGNKERKIAGTNLNDRSSRSHTIFRIIIESTDMHGTKEDRTVQTSYLNLVDLAGSERADQTGATGSRLQEAGNINKSLLYLSCVIQKLSENSSDYINYRDSKLTRILQASLGGNALTAIICNITPAALEETYSTLRFGTQAKAIKNKPIVNEEISDAVCIKRMVQELSRMEQELETLKKEKTNDHQKISHLQKQIFERESQFLRSKQKFTSDVQRRRTWCPSFNSDALIGNIQPLENNVPPIFVSNSKSPNIEEFASSINSDEPCFEHLANNKAINSAQRDIGSPVGNKSLTVFSVPTPNAWKLSNFGERPSISPDPKNYKKKFKDLALEFEDLENFTKLETKIETNELVADLKKTRQELAEAKELLQMYEASGEKWESPAEETDHEIFQQTLKTKCTQLETNLEQAKSDVAKMESERNNILIKTNALESELEKAKKSAELCNVQKDSIEFEFEQFKIKSKARESELINALNDSSIYQVDELKHKVHVLDDQLKEAEIKLFNKEKLLDILENNNRELIEKLNRLEKLPVINEEPNESSLANELEALKLELAQLEKQYKNENKLAQEEANRLQYEYDEMSTKLMDAIYESEQTDKLRVDLATTKEALNELQQKHEQLLQKNIDSCEKDNVKSEENSLKECVNLFQNQINAFEKYTFDSTGNLNDKLSRLSNTVAEFKMQIKNKHIETVSLWNALINLAQLCDGNKDLPKNLDAKTFNKEAVQILATTISNHIEQLTSTKWNLKIELIEINRYYDEQILALKNSVNDLEYQELDLTEQCQQLVEIKDRKEQGILQLEKQFLELKSEKEALIVDKLEIEEKLKTYQSNMKNVTSYSSVLQNEPPNVTKSLFEELSGKQPPPPPPVFEVSLLNNGEKSAAFNESNYLQLQCNFEELTMEKEELTALVQTLNENISKEHLHHAQQINELKDSIEQIKAQQPVEQQQSSSDLQQENLNQLKIELEKVVLERNDLYIVVEHNRNVIQQTELECSSLKQSIMEYNDIIKKLQDENDILNTENKESLKNFANLKSTHESQCLNRKKEHDIENSKREEMNRLNWEQLKTIKKLEEENRNLQHDIQVQQTSIEELQQSNEVLNSTSVSHNDEQLVNREPISNVVEEHEADNTNIDESRQLSFEQQKSNDENESRLAIFEQQKSILEEKNANLLHENELQKALIDELNRSKETLTTQLSNLKQEHEELLENIKSLHMRIANLNEEFNAANSKREEYQQLSCEQQKSIDKLEETNKILLNDMHIQQISIEELKQSKDGLNSELSNAQLKHEELLENVETLQNRIVDLNNQLDGEQSKRSVEQENATELMQKMYDIEAKESLIDELKQSNEMLNTRLNSKEREHKELLENCVSLQKQIFTLNNEKDAENSKQDEIQRLHLEEQKKAIEMLEEKNTNLMRDIEIQQTLTDDLKYTNETLISKLNQLEQDHDQLLDHVKSLQTRISNLEQENVNIDAECNILKSEKIILIEKCQTFDSNSCDTAKKMSEMKIKYENILKSSKEEYENELKSIHQEFMQKSGQFKLEPPSPEDHVDINPKNLFNDILKWNLTVKHEYEQNDLEKDKILKETLDKNNALELSLKELSNKYEQLLSKNRENISSMMEQNQTIQRLEQEMKGLNVQMDECNANNEQNIVSHLNEKSKIVNDFNNQKVALDTQISKYKTELETLNEQFKELKVTYEAKQKSDSVNFENNLKSTETKLSDLMRLHQADKESLRNLQCQLNEKEMESNVLQKRLADSKTMLDEVSNENMKFSNELADLQKLYTNTIASYTNEIERLSKDNNKIGLENKSLLASLAETDLKYKEIESVKLKEQSQLHQSHMDKLKGEQKQLMQQLHEMQKMHAHKVQQLEEEIGAYSKDQSLLKSELNEIKIKSRSDQSFQEKEAKIVALEKQLQEFERLRNSINNDRRSRRQSMHDNTRPRLSDNWPFNSCSISVQTDPALQDCSCEEMDLKIQELQRDNRIKEGQIGAMQLTMQNNPIRTENEKLKKTIVMMENEIQRIAMENIKLKNVIQEKSTTTTTNTIVNKVSRACQTDVEKKLISLDSNGSDLITASDNAKLKEHLNILQFKYDNVKKLCRLRAQEISTLKEENEKCTQANGKSAEKTKEQCLKCIELENRIQMIEIENNIFKNVPNAGSSSANENIDSNGSNIPEPEITKLQNTLDTMQLKYDNLKKLCRMRAQEISTLKQHIEQIEQQSKQDCLKCIELETNIQTIATENNKLKNLMQTSGGGTFENENIDSNGSNLIAEREIFGLQKSLETMQLKYDSIKKLCRLRAQEISTLKTAGATNVKPENGCCKCTEIEDEKTTIKSDLEVLKQKYETVKKLCQMRNEEIKNLQRKIDQQNQSNSNPIITNENTPINLQQTKGLNDITSLKNENISLKHERNTLQETIKQQQAQIKLEKISPCSCSSSNQSPQTNENTSREDYLTSIIDEMELELTAIKEKYNKLESLYMARNRQIQCLEAKIANTNSFV